MINVQFEINKALDIACYLIILLIAVTFTKNLLDNFTKKPYNLVI